ncbi:glycosyltransferase [Acuticoccus yangtzensis]|uniref:glycosyltransferase n=1 Tax=Acuticoccus yangtzensis TaxID=1443441 RepID=UPI0009497CF3|nr:glycosyltransferase [Acuticoccus yangtzensis]
MTPAIVLATLRAEGGPALAADLCAEWSADGHAPVALVLSGRETAMAPRFAALGIPVRVLGIDRAAPRDWPRIAAATARALRGAAADALVSIPNGVHGAILAGAAMAGISRRLVHVGNYPWHWQADFWKYRLTMRASAPLTPDLVSVTAHVDQGVKAHFGRVARRHHVVPNGIDLARFPFRAPRPAPDGRLAVLMVARLDSGKNHAALIRAIALLRGRGVDATLRLAGDGSLGGALEALAAECGVGDAVRFLGARRDVPDLLATADVFAFAVRPEEGLGIAMVEAMATGVPIAASDVGACREVLADGDAGHLVASDTPEAWADALMTAARDTGRVVVARRRAESVYSRRAMADGYARILGLSR